MPTHTELTDKSAMPYGAHVNKPMEEVPADYLLYLWNQGLNAATKEDSKRGTVARYIKTSMKALEKDSPDTIISKEA